MEKEFDIRLCMKGCKKGMKVVLPCLEEVLNEHESYSFEGLEIISDCINRMSSLKDVVESIALSHDESILFVMYFYNELLIILDIINMNPGEFLDLVNEVISLRFVVSEVSTFNDYYLPFNYIKDVLELLELYPVEDFDKLEFKAISSPDGGVDMYVIKCGTEFFHTSIKRLIDKDFMPKDLFEENR